MFFHALLLSRAVQVGKVKQLVFRVFAKGTYQAWAAGTQASKANPTPVVKETFI
jgi:hypothetical protein